MSGYRYFILESSTLNMNKTYMSPSYATIDGLTYGRYISGEILDSWQEITEEEFNLWVEENFPEPNIEPKPEPMPETDQAILDTAVNMEYLLSLQELGLLVISE